MGQLAFGFEHQASIDYGHWCHPQLLLAQSTEGSRGDAKFIGVIVERAMLAKVHVYQLTKAGHLLAATGVSGCG